MTDLDRALGDISSIRRQVARSTEFHGYGPATLAVTGALAVAAAQVQLHWVPYPRYHPFHYLCVWISTAILSAALIGAQMFTRTRRIHSGLADEMILLAVEQFLPSAAAGALVAVVLARFVPAELWMLPGLWQVIFGLGIFASCRFLPRPIALAGAWYLLTGLFCIRLANGRALSPWAMGIPYAAGQLLVAGILLFCTREDRDER
jgi:hypothetical protein